jgi:PTS system nitrogen regulatory IIA component
MLIPELLARGKVWYNVPGKNPAEFISALVSSLRLPVGIRKEDLTQACIRREASSPTAMGRGIAFPHPGEPVVTSAEDAFVALAYPRFPVDWRAPDGAPVRAAFLIVSASRNDHLTTLSTLAKLCGKDAFHEALLREAKLEELVGLTGA